jgi:hypothetical protein
MRDLRRFVIGSSVSRLMFIADVTQSSSASTSDPRPAARHLVSYGWALLTQASMTGCG